MSDLTAPMSEPYSLIITIGLKAAFYGLLSSLKTAAIEVVKLIYEALVYVLTRNEALSFIEAFCTLLDGLALFPTALIGIHFQALGVSPLHTHFAIILLFFMATIVHRIAYMEIKLQPQDAVLRFICLVSGIMAIELLFAIIISPFWLFMVNLCPILILGVLRHLYQQIYQCVYYTTNLEDLSIT
ncbi:hypothetical protein ACB092_09G014800 [Castanea dentata]